MRSNFFWTAPRMALVGAAVLVALVVGLALRPPALGDWSRLVLVAVVALSPAVVLFLVDRVQHRQAGVVAAGVSGTRPGGTVVPVVALARSRAAGQALGLPTADVSAPAGTVTAGRRTWPAASITDGTVTLAVAPRYTPRAPAGGRRRRAAGARPA